MRSQEAIFVFKLRRNILLDGDLSLAEAELRAFLPDSPLEPLLELESLFSVEPALSQLEGAMAVGDHVRESGIQGFRAFATLDLVPLLVRRLTFIQSLYCVTDASSVSQQDLDKLERAVGSLIEHHTTSQNKLIVFAVPLYTVVELSDVTVRHSRTPAEVRRKLPLLLDGLLSRSRHLGAVKEAGEALDATKTTSHLSHDMHYYKAKFFPRLVRSTLNVCSQRLGGGTLRVIDSFCGSGTTLLEASLLGMPSVGIDIDPLSVMISRCKMDILSIPASRLEGEVDSVVRALEISTVGRSDLFSTSSPANRSKRMCFPSWLMMNRNMTDDIARVLIDEIETLLDVVDKASPEMRDFFLILASDAIARKIRMRFLGTGVGRFSLTFAKQTIADIFRKSATRYACVVAAVEWLKDIADLEFAKWEIREEDARDFAPEGQDFDILLTSPPYLPAASGRESYTRAHAPSLIALGLATHGELELLANGSIGSMEGTSVSMFDLTENELKVVKWLAADDLRSIKAMPTAKYFLDMRSAFEQMHKYLRPGAMAVVVSGKQSTFYEFKTRKELFVAQSAKLLAEEASRAGFDVEALQDLKLHKSNLNARPRSLDDYYETLIFLRRPDR